MSWSVHINIPQNICRQHGFDIYRSHNARRSPRNGYVRNRNNSTDRVFAKIKFTQNRHADDGSAASDLKCLRAILDNLDVHGKAFDYNVKPSRCQPKIKENRRECALKTFEEQILK